MFNDPSVIYIASFDVKIRSDSFHADIEIS